MKINFTIDKPVRKRQITLRQLYKILDDFLRHGYELTIHAKNCEDIITITVTMADSE